MRKTLKLNILIIFIIRYRFGFFWFGGAALKHYINWLWMKLVTKWQVSMFQTKVGFYKQSIDVLSSQYRNKVNTELMSIVLRVSLLFQTDKTEFRIFLPVQNTSEQHIFLKLKCLCGSCHIFKMHDTALCRISGNSPL